MRKGKRYLEAAALLIAGCFVVYIVVALFMSKEVASSEGVLKVNLYFLNPSLNKLEAEPRDIQQGDKKSTVQALITALVKEGPRNAALVKSVPFDSESIEQIILTNEDTAVVYCTESYNSLTAAEEIFCRSALVWTLTELPFVDNVSIYVGEDELVKANGHPMGLLNRDNVVIDPIVPVEKKETQTLKLYFSDDQAMGLVAEERMVEVNPDQALENYAIEELLKGPSNKNMITLIPVDVKLLSNIKTEESICILNLSKEFSDKQAGGSTAVRLTIYSIVNTLAEIPNVKKVQFLIEGQKIQDFKGVFDLSKPIEPDKTLILE